MKKLLLALMMIVLIIVIYYSFTLKEGEPNAVILETKQIPETVDTNILKPKENLLHESMTYSPFWLVFNRFSFTQKKKKVMSEEEQDALINAAEQLKREIYLQEGYIHVLEKSQTQGQWEELYRFISEHQSATTYKNEDNYSVSDILIAARAPDTVIQKYIDGHPPTTLTVFELVYTRYLEDSPQLVNRILSYFSADSLLKVNLAGMSNVNLLKLAKQNDRNDILRFYDMVDYPFFLTDDQLQKSVAKNYDQSVEIKEAVAHAPYFAKKIVANNSEQCRELARQSFLGFYGDTFAGMSYSIDINRSIKAHSYHLQKYNQRKKEVFSSVELPEDFFSNPQRYFYSTAIYKVLKDNGDDIKDSEYIPDLYGMQIATSPHFPNRRFTLLENLVRKTESKLDRLSLLSYMSGGADGLAEALRYGVMLQPDSGEDVLHWSYRNETPKETEELLTFLSNYNFVMDDVHKAMRKFKALCIKE